MKLMPLLFFIFIGLAVVAAGAIILSKNVFRSALWLLVCLLSVAALYVLTLAEFLAVAQILVYAGGIMVVIIFGIMLTTRITGKPLHVGHRHVGGGILAATALFFMLAWYVPDLPDTGVAAGPLPVSEMGLLVFSRYVFPFEIAGLLLLVALVGAAVITAQRKTDTR